jgi:glycerate kinase
MRVLAAPDKFRGTATAAEVADAIAAAASEAGWDCDRAPVADGGEGLLDCFGGANHETEVTGPSGDRILAAWRLDGDRAVIEMARASGQAVAGERHDPVRATTRGTGELVAAALEGGASDIVVGAGGSATTDGGLGAVEVLERYRPLDGSRGPRVRVATDVTTRFLRAAEVFGPQKGADEQQVAELTGRLRRLAEQYRERYGVDVERLDGSGAAGGLAGGLAALGAAIVPGFGLVADHLDLRRRVRDADLVITGEGHLDETSLAGKSVGGVLELAAGSTPAAIVVGRADPGLDPDAIMVSLTERFGEERALRATLACIREATAELLAGRRPGRN